MPESHPAIFDEIRDMLLTSSYGDMPVAAFHGFLFSQTI
ncbi:hypothetical protein SMB34_07350 [Thalassospira permensis NBRC 106175]|uniref:Uncharacterized protein n=1 Tax=Thalassospira permensis NBRC 106175 TaxID=1353532 RepID=A0ABR4TJF4_9PROT|nr:hypothetical protein SMB34_07350 [Thalassospira permensis NBRC 106175]